MSLAVALLHQPELLILDEPTVGVDALLRAKLWHYLLELVKTEDVTILITTHYIEEARQADIVGLMRDGRLLAEAAPSELLARYRKDTLEDVFLELCRNHVSADEEREQIEPADDEAVTLLPSSGQSSLSPFKLSDWLAESFPVPVWSNIYALLWKNVTRIRYDCCHV